MRWHFWVEDGYWLEGRYEWALNLWLVDWLDVGLLVAFLLSREEDVAVASNSESFDSKDSTFNEMFSLVSRRDW
jgi:hypothetical protein